MRPRDPDGEGFDLAAWNLDNNRSDRAVKAEAETLLRETGAGVLAYQEGQEYADDLARIPGYSQHPEPGRDRSGRDAGLLVRDGLRVTRSGLVRTKVRWPRDKRPGLHWPRSFPWADVDGVRVVSVHMPRQHHALAYATCWTALLLLALRTRGPIILIGDWNKAPRRRGMFTPHALAKALDAQLVGDGIDFAIARSVGLGGGGRVRHGNSDHDPRKFNVRRKP